MPKRKPKPPRMSDALRDILAEDHEGTAKANSPGRYIDGKDGGDQKERAGSQTDAIPATPSGNQVGAIIDLVNNVADIAGQGSKAKRRKSIAGNGAGQGSNATHHASNARPTVSRDSQHKHVANQSSDAVAFGDHFVTVDHDHRISVPDGVDQAIGIVDDQSGNIDSDLSTKATSDVSGDLSRRAFDDDAEIGQIGLAESRQATTDLGVVLNRLAELQAMRRSLISAKNVLINKAKAITRRQLNWYSGDADDVRKGINARAAKIVDTIFAGKPLAADDAETVAGIFLSLIIFRKMAAPAIDGVKQIEKAMARLAATTPGRGFVEQQRGASLKGLGVLLGEAGNIANYPKPGHLCKRFGVAPFVKDGTAHACSTWRMQGGLTSKEWADRERGPKYNPHRRAELYAVIGDSLIRAKGAYYDLYLERKDYERRCAEARGLRVMPAARIPAKDRDGYMSDMHIHMRAKRYMEQRFLIDLWKAWRAAANVKISSDQASTASARRCRADGDQPASVQ